MLVFLGDCEMLLLMEKWDIISGARKKGHEAYATVRDWNKLPYQNSLHKLNQLMKFHLNCGWKQFQC